MAWMWCTAVLCGAGAARVLQTMDMAWLRVRLPFRQQLPATVQEKFYALR